VSAPQRFDAVVIGAGAGGTTVAIGLTRLGWSVALVERGAIGGDCTNVGCIPSKTLLDLSAAFAANAAAAGRGEASAVLAAVRARRAEVRARDEAKLAELDSLALVRGHARLVPAAGRTPEVLVEAAAGGAPRRLAARHVVLATGSRPVIVHVPGLEAGVALTNEHVFELMAPPRHLAVIGGGATGCELALSMRRLGSEVTLIERAPRLLPGSEPEAAAVVAASLQGAGVRLLTGADPERYSAQAARLTLRRGDERLAVGDVDRVLMACGRRPASDGLGLDEVGVRTVAGAIVTDSRHRTSVAGVHAIGDVTGRVASTHAANAQGRRLVRRLALPVPLLPEGDYPTVTFTDPEVAQIGPTLAELARRYPAELLVSHRVDLSDTDRGRTLGLEHGFVRLTAMRASGRLLAATIVAPFAGEMIHLLTWAQRRRVSLWQLSRLVAAYPTLGEAVRRAADAFVFATLPDLPRQLATYVRWRWRGPHPVR
jgi:dihydrolipoamide dehydrogenase